MSNAVDNNKLIRWLTYMMFLMFAMTTDAVGVIIPEIIKEYNLSLSQAGLFHQRRHDRRRRCNVREPDAATVC